MEEAQFHCAARCCSHCSAWLVMFKVFLQNPRCGWLRGPKRLRDVQLFIFLVRRVFHIRYTRSDSQMQPARDLWFRYDSQERVQTILFLVSKDQIATYYFL